MHEAHCRDANKAQGEAQCFIGHRGSALSALLQELDHALTVLKDLPINTLKKLTHFNRRTIIHFSMPSKTTSDNFLHIRFSEKAYFGWINLETPFLFLVYHAILAIIIVLQMHFQG